MTKEKTSKKQNIFFQIIGVELLGTTINHPQKQLPERINFHFKINLEYKINVDKKFVFVATFVTVSDKNDKETQLGTITTSCNFKISNLDEFMDKENNEVLFPDEILFMFNSISISTTRGIMFSQFKGTFLDHAYLPIIDPKSFKLNK